MKGSWERIKEITQERRQKEIKGFGCWKEIKTNAKAGLVVTEPWKKSRGPEPLDCTTGSQLDDPQNRRQLNLVTRSWALEQDCQAQILALQPKAT